MDAQLWSVDLGTGVPYDEALALQYRVRDARRAELIPDTVLCLEHAPVYTRGRRSEDGDLPLPEAWYVERGIEIVDVNRGGKITYHGPGQLVLYPICAVADVPRFVCALERAMVAAVARHGVDARGRSCEDIALTGAWVEQRKIGSIGLRVSRGVSTHGLALNVDGDLDPFSWVVACGLPDVAMTSIAAELGDDVSAPDVATVRHDLLAALAGELDATIVGRTREQLEQALELQPSQGTGAST